MSTTTNKLRKSGSPLRKPSFPSNSASSRTLQYARSSTTNTTITTQSQHLSPSPSPSFQVPLTAGEQYWAGRALHAETLLAAQESHRKDVRTLGHAQDMKRERELASLAKEHKEKQIALEKMFMLLLGLIVLLVVLVIYLATHYTRHSILMDKIHRTSWWSAIGASHFTIPILSPFTSVVENETSVIGAKTMGSFAAIGACLAFFVFRHWIAHKSTGNKSGAAVPASLSSRVAQNAMTSTSRAIDR